MLMHPDMGFVDGGVDLLDPVLYAECQKQFGHAASMPRLAYLSDVFQQLENEKIWTRDWVCVGTTAEIANAGDLLPYTIGEHAIHVQRTASGSLVGRFNKAQHGGCRVVPAQCRTGKKTKCSFTSCGHSRDRNVIPGTDLEEMSQAMGQYLGLVPERLLPVKIEVLGPFIFANIDPTIGEEHLLPKLEWDNSLERQSGFWREHRANWKVSGKSVIEAAHAHMDQTRVHGETEWHFPNLITVRFSGMAATIILQPTAMGQTLWRVSCFAEQGEKKESLFTQIDQILDDAILRAEAVQNKIAMAQMEEVTEQSKAGWEFNQILLERLAQQHVAYWNAPLTDARAG